MDVPVNICPKLILFLPLCRSVATSATYFALFTNVIIYYIINHNIITTLTIRQGKCLLFCNYLHHSYSLACFCLGKFAGINLKTEYDECTTNQSVDQGTVEIPCVNMPTRGRIFYLDKLTKTSRLCEVEVFGSSKYSCDVDKCVLVNDARSGKVMMVFLFQNIGYS